MWTKLGRRKGRHEGPAEVAGPGVPGHGLASHADAQRDPRDLRARTTRVRVLPRAGADRRADLLRAAVPPASAGRPGSAGQPGVGRRRGVRPELPRASLGAAPAGQRGPAARADRPDRLPVPGPDPPVVGGLRDRGARRGSGRDPGQVAPDPGRRGGDRRPRSGDARRGPRPGAAGPRRVAPGPGAHPRLPDRLRGRGRAWSVRSTLVSTARGNVGALLRTADAARTRADARRGRALQPQAGPRHPGHRVALPAAAGGDDRHRPGRLPPGAPGARHQRQRRGAGHRHRRAAGLADDPGRGAARDQAAQGGRARCR